MKRLSAVIPAVILAATLAIILFGCSMRSSFEPAVLPPETKALTSESPATFVPVPVATAVPTEDVQNSPRILSHLKDVSVSASQNIELSVKAENAVAYSWIFTSPSSYAKGGDVIVFAEEPTEALPANGFTVSGANSSTLKLTHVPYSLNGWTVQVQCFGRNGATAIGIPVSISVTQPQPLPIPSATERLYVNSWGRAKRRNLIQRSMWQATCSFVLGAMRHNGESCCGSGRSCEHRSKRV